MNGDGCSDAFELIVDDDCSRSACAGAASTLSRSGPLRFTAIVLSNRSSVTPGERRRNRRDTGVVDEDVDPTELGDGGVDQGSRTGAQSPTWHDTASGATERAHLVGDGLARVELRLDHDVGTGLREAEGHRAPEALAASGHHDDLAVAPEHASWSVLAPPGGLGGR